MTKRYSWPMWAVLLCTLFAGAVDIDAQSPRERASDPGDLGARFWQLAGSIPTSVSPLLDDTKCQVGQNGSTWLLFSTAPASETLGSPTESHCTIPTGRSIVLALTAAFCFREPGQTLKDIRQECAQGLDAPQLLRLEIDGRDRSRLIERRTSDRPFTMGVTDDNVFGLPGGYFTAVHDGYFATLPALAPGDHTIVAQSLITLDDGTPIAFDTIHQIHIVEPAARLAFEP